MKTRILIPIISLLISTSSFAQPSATGSKSFATTYEDVEPLFGVDDCAVATIITAIYNGMEFGQKLGQYQFTFCPDGSIEITHPNYGYMSGRWEFAEAGAPIFIHLDAPEWGSQMYADLAWLDGLWNVIEHSANALELHRQDGNDYYRVRWHKLFR